MWRKSRLLFILITISFAACVPSRSGSYPDLPRIFSTRPSARVETPSPTVRVRPVEIPMQAGYGADGGWYQLYFTDPANPLAGEWQGGPDEPLVSAIDAARLEVDVAAYSLNLYSVRSALLRAFRRGVQVRLVVESDNLDYEELQELKEAGLPILGDRREGLMHNKFLVIDRSEVWTGSMNYTLSGVYGDNNNLIHIHSQQVARDYQTEFEEMFLDDRFGPDLGGETPFPRVLINGIPLDIYFSPDDHVQAGLLDLVGTAQSSIDFLAYSFTSDPLGQALRQKAAGGVKVRGVMEADQVRSNAGSEFDQFRAAGLDVRLDGNPGLMHHKVLIIDGQVVVLGSYNFSYSAETRNDENLIVIYDPAIAGLFQQEFQRIVQMAQP